MSIQLYVFKRNFAVQKAERYLKERGIPYQVMDLKKHRLGRRELELFIRGRNAKDIINMEDEAVKSHPIAYAPNEQIMLDYLMENPGFLISPIIRNGQKILLGFDEKLMAGLVG